MKETPVPAGIDHVVLVGLMGSGKTTVGRALAAELGWPFRDSDAVIEATTGRIVRELAERLGPDRLHELEAEQLRRALAEPGPSVVAAAASVVEDADCRHHLRAPSIAVVWLRAPPEVLAERFASSAHRPLFGEPLAVLSEQARRREPLFAALGGLVVDVDRAPAGAVVRSVLRALRRWSPDGARSSGPRAPAGRGDGAGDDG